eukprot:Skav227557  [mRNA]  locus=scaffold3241:143068:152294:+ [translate_table: standard]
MPFPGVASDSSLFVSIGERLLRLKPENLQTQEVDDSQWAPGDQARVVGLHDGSAGEELQKKHGGTLDDRIRCATESESARWGIVGPCPWLTGAAVLATALAPWTIGALPWSEIEAGNSFNL